jgi:hypothetical protein
MVNCNVSMPGMAYSKSIRIGIYKPEGIDCKQWVLPEDLQHWQVAEVRAKV